MKNFLVILSLLFTITANAQTDTTKLITIDSTLFIRNIQPAVDIMYFDGCAHGHICCYAHCPCCPELQRTQIYDTISSKVTNGVRRVIVRERYEIASAHDVKSIHVRFYSNGSWSNRFYPLDSRAQRSFVEYHTGQAPLHKETFSYERDEILVFNNDRQYMLLNLEGKEVPMLFQTITAFTPELSIGSCVIDNKVLSALLKPDGTRISRTEYVEIYPFNEDGLAIVHSTNGSGVIDRNGKEVIPSKYYTLNRIGENRYCAGTSYGSNHIYDGEGNCITKKEYDHIENYSEGLAFARMKNNALCFLDMDGKEVLRVKEEWAYDFQDGLAAVMQGEKWGFIDKTGKLVIPCQYYKAHEFYDGVAPVATGVMNNEKWILIDKNGKQVNAKEYSEIMAFKKGIAQVRINGIGYGFIDTKGKEVVECKYADFGYGTEDRWDVQGMFIRSEIINRKPAGLELVDTTGKQLVNLDPYIAARFCPYGYHVKQVHPFIQVYKSNNKTNLVDFQGKVLFREDYDQILVYSAELVVGIKDGQYAILNPVTGKVVSNFKTKQINNIEYGIVTVIKDINSYIYEHYNLEGTLIEE